jgi:hypothetical protein
MVEEEHQPYRIPDEDTIKEIVHRVMKDNGTIRSQTLFHRLIVERLRSLDPGFSLKLSAPRLRRIAASMSGMKMTIHCRDSDENFKGNRCPVCGSNMAVIRNQTLYGWTVNTGKLCNTCSYWTGTRMRKPVRYVFSLEQPSGGNDN